MTFAILLPLAAAALTGGGTWLAEDVAMFERRQLNPELSLVAFGVMEETRCRANMLCLDPGRLVVAMVVSWRGQEREVPMELGSPVRVGGGTLTLVSTATPATGTGAIQLKRYRLTFAYSEE